MKSKTLLISLTCTFILFQANPANARNRLIPAATAVIAGVAYYQWDHLKPYWKELSAACVAMGIGGWLSSKEKAAAAKPQKPQTPPKTPPASPNQDRSEGEVIFPTAVPALNLAATGLGGSEAVALPNLPAETRSETETKIEDPRTESPTEQPATAKPANNSQVAEGYLASVD